MTVVISAALVLTLIQAPVPTAGFVQTPRTMNLREAVAREHVRPAPESRQAPQAASGHAHHSRARKVAFAVAGGAVGLVAGALVGAEISDAIGCDCFLPGPRGAFFGGIGGAVGGVFLGKWLASR